MLLISIGIAAGLSLPRRTDWALRQKKAGFRHFSFLNTIKDQRHLDLSKLQTQPRILSPTPRHEKCQPSCTLMLSRTSSEFFCKASYLMCSQSTPSKNGLLFISSTPDAPILCSHSQQNLRWKEEWKWRQKWKHPIQKWNSFPNWQHHSFPTYKMERAKDSHFKDNTWSYAQQHHIKSCSSDVILFHNRSGEQENIQSLKAKHGYFCP